MNSIDFCLLTGRIKHWKTGNLVFLRYRVNYLFMSDQYVPWGDTVEQYLPLERQHATASTVLTDGEFHAL